jgi:hypothetical protein
MAKRHGLHPDINHYEMSITLPTIPHVHPPIPQHGRAPQ